MDDAWGTIDEMIEWLDGGSTLDRKSKKLIRIMKLTEEGGEVTQGVIGTLGQNPRKGVTHTWEDVQAELCDVIVAAMVALATLTPDARVTFEAISPASPAAPRHSQRCRRTSYNLATKPIGAATKEQGLMPKEEPEPTKK